MSIHIMNAVWSSGPQDLPGRMLLLAIADNANERGEAFPSLAVLGQKACMSKSTVIRTLQRLAAEGWLAVRHREAAPEGYGRARGNLYCVSLQKLKLASSGKTASSRSVTVTPRPEVVPARGADSAACAGNELRGVRLTPRREKRPDEVSDEVSNAGARGVKTGFPPTPPLVGEPSGTISEEPPPPTPSATEGELLADSPLDEATLRKIVANAPRTSAEYFAAARRLIELRKQSAPPADAVHDPPDAQPRRRRRWTPAMVGMDTRGVCR